MSTKNQVEEVLKLLGVDRNNRQDFKVVVFFLLSAVLGIDSIFLIVKRWSDTNRRFMAMRDMNILITIGVIAAEFRLTPRYVETLILITKHGYFINNYEALSRRHQNEIYKSDVRLKQLKTILFITCIAIIMTSMFTPLAIIFYTSVTQARKFSDMKIEDLPTPILFWYPKGFDTLPVYITVYMSNILYYLFMWGFAYSHITSSLTTIHTILVDMRLFCFCFEEINDMKILDIEPHMHEDATLHVYLSLMIKYHQIIIRKVSLLNVSVEKLFSIVNHGLCVQLCMSLYCCVEMDDVLFRMQHILFVASLIFLMYMLCSNGEHIVQGSLEMRKQISECDWTNKPHWFKKSILVMMTCSNVPSEVRPYRAYNMNLNNFTSAVNAAYSWLNVLRSLQH